MPSEAEDIASDTWIDAARGLKRFKGGERDFRKWMFTIARRRLIDQRRRSLRHPTQPVPVEQLQEVPALSDVEAETVATLTAREAIGRMVELLPADQAEVVLLRVVGGLSAEETGQVMGKRAGTVRVLQHRALERLSRAMDDADVTERPSQAM
jgi:RNA polymerase sigma-70 factor (ECF subfamily)